MVVFALFVLLTLVAVASALAALLLGQLRLRTSAARSRDGLRPGTQIARQSFGALDGSRVHVPSGDWLVLLFADHSLLEFPVVIDDIRSLHSGGVPIVVLAKQLVPTLTASLFEGEGLQLPIVPNASSIYTRFGIVAMPAAVIVDGTGLVRAAGLVNVSGSLTTLWSIAHADPDELRAYLQPNYREILFD